MKRTSTPKTASKPLYLAKAIANCHGGQIIIARPSTPGSIQVAPIVLGIGKSIPITDKKTIDGISREEWEDLKKTNAGVRQYLDHGLLKEVKEVGDVDIRVIKSSNPPIPPHLQRDDEAFTGGETGRSAMVRRKTPSKITID